MDRTTDPVFRPSRIAALRKVVPCGTAILAALALGPLLLVARHFLVAAVSGDDFPSYFDRMYGVAAIEVRFVFFTLFAVMGLLFMAALRLVCEWNERLARRGFAVCATLTVMCLAGILASSYRAYLCIFIGYSAEGALVSALALAYMATVWLMSNRSRQLGHWAFAVPATLMGLSLLALLLSPVYRLTLYVIAMGVTPMRLCGLLYALIAALVIFCFVWWALRQEPDDGRAEHAVAA